MELSTLRDAMPACDRWSVRALTQRDDELTIERGVLRAPTTTLDQGAMVSIQVGAGQGYAATSDTSPSGLRTAAARALHWANHASSHPLAGLTTTDRAPSQRSFESRCDKPWGSVPVADKIARLTDACKPLADADLAMWLASFWSREVLTEIWSSEGSHHHQQISVMLPSLMLFAKTDEGTVRRSLGRSRGAQGGLEVLDQVGYDSAAQRLLTEVRQLASAKPCPQGRFDLLLAPDQMMIQIHESIGHPLEVDRILGDERNFAGTTFVTPEMVGSFTYGSELLNIEFDPGIVGEIASYAFDDEGTPATKEFLIENGILKRVLGAELSQKRSGLPGVACARASNWRRPPIDRMANLNLVPGTSTAAELVASVEDGIYMETNESWSIDDSRNKFQFSAEFGRRIRNGELAEIVRKPGYRGESRAFWRGLVGVGNRDSHEVHGTPYCGKGEPNQIVTVGHASPPCVFSNVEVFGGR